MKEKPPSHLTEGFGFFKKKQTVPSRQPNLWAGTPTAEQRRKIRTIGHAVAGDIGRR